MLIQWTGAREWSTGMERWNGALEWSTGMDYWNRALEHAVLLFLATNEYSVHCSVVFLNCILTFVYIYVLI